MLDASQIFDGTLPSTGAAITTTRVSTNVIDWLTGRDMGAGDPLGIHVQVIQAFTGGTSMVIDLEVCDTVGGTYLNILSTPIIPVAQLIAGEQLFRYAYPPNQVLNATAGILKVPGRYARLNYTIVGTMTGGTVFSYINPRPDRNVFYAYPANYTVRVDADQI